MKKKRSRRVSVPLDRLVGSSDFPFTGYTFDDDGKLYCKACGAYSKREHSDVCPHIGHWPTRAQIRTANDQADRTAKAGERIDS